MNKKGESEAISVKIPEELAREFGKEMRVTVFPPRLIGIVLDPSLGSESKILEKLMKAGALKDFNIVITPKEEE